MTDLITTKKKPTKASQSNAQKAFTRLTKKIKALQQELRSTEVNLDRALHYYQDAVGPLKKSLIVAITDFVKTTHGHYKKNQQLSKKERLVLKDFLMGKIEELFHLVPFEHIDQEIRAIVEDLDGVAFDKIKEAAVDEFKENMQEMFEEMGLDLDLSDIESNDTQETIMRKLFAAVQEAGGDAEDLEDEILQPKTKKEIDKETKEKELEVLQKKGLGPIYKQLAKVLHPDLEQDPVQKVKKEELMKRLTAAYESNDLHALLTLELECMNLTNQGPSGKSQSDEQLKVYNSLLKEQIEDLQHKIDTAVLNPKYELIQSHFEADFLKGTHRMKIMIEDFKGSLKAYKALTKDMHSNAAIHTLRSLIQMQLYNY